LERYWNRRYGPVTSPTTVIRPLIPEDFVHTEPSDEKFPSTDLLTDTFLAMEAFTGGPLDLYIGAVLRADGPVPAISELRAMVGDKLESMSSLTLRTVETPTGRRWEPDPDFDLARHVTLLRNAPVDAAPAGSWLKSTPDRDHPLWRMFLVPGDGEGWAVVYLVHHAMQDGTAMVSALETLFGKHPAVAVASGPKRRRAVHHALLATSGLLGTMNAPPHNGRRRGNPSLVHTGLSEQAFRCRRAGVRTGRHQAGRRESGRGHEIRADASGVGEGA
jgi:hypothetical protein